MANKKAVAVKEEAVKALAEKIKGSNIVLLVDYRGITVEQVTGLRAELRKINSDCKVIKNNIIKRALELNGETGLDEVLAGPTAVITSEEDYLSTAKLIYNFSKSNEFYKIKGGIIEGKVMSEQEIITLAKLPSRQELLSKLAGSLLGNITKLAVALDQVKAQKEA